MDGAIIKQALLVFFGACNMESAVKEAPFRPQSPSGATLRHLEEGVGEEEADAAEVEGRAPAGRKSSSTGVTGNIEEEEEQDRSMVTARQLLQSAARRLQGMRSVSQDAQRLVC